MQNIDTILIIDYGSQVTKLIARRVREMHVYSVIVPFHKALDSINSIKPKGIILSGGPASVYHPGSPSLPDEVFTMNIPIFGICYGQQLIAQKLGGKVAKAPSGEYGDAFLTILKQSQLVENEGAVWMSHEDIITEIPEGFEITAVTHLAPFAVIENTSKHIYGVQFHPEVTHTATGHKIIRNFVFNICKCNPTWQMKDYIKTQLEDIKTKCGDKQVICALSGGVDSSVAAMLVHKAIGKNLTCIFVDTGLMRKNEAQDVKISLESLGLNIKYIDAKGKFFNGIAGISDPEEKRKIIGRIFIEIFDEQASMIEDAAFLVQGTIYPDVIESCGVEEGASAKIKSHHNVGGLPKEMKFKLIEPLRELFKDEVRELGKQINLPDHIIKRHPFPGPGLGIRIIGDVTPEKVRILQEADAIYIEELKKADLYDKIWQAFCVLLPCKTVGVMGDGRTYDYVLAIRAVNSIDGMTADVYPFDMQFLCKLSTLIVNNVKGINRVTFDVTSKPPATIEWE